MSLSRYGELSDNKGGKAMKDILIIEDEYDLKEAIKIRLTGEGFRISSAGNAEQGLRLAREIKPDLVIMDLVLPGRKDGLEATYEMKNDEVLKGIPVIILTAKGSEEDRKRGLREGCDVYMTKPFDHEELVSRIKSLIGEE